MHNAAHAPTSKITFGSVIKVPAGVDWKPVNSLPQSYDGVADGTFEVIDISELKVVLGVLLDIVK